MRCYEFRRRYSESLSSSTVTLSAYTSTPPVIDGVIGANEWANAATQTFVTNQVNPPYQGKIYVMNDATHLYIAFALSGGTITPSPLLITIFDNNNTGTVVAGDDSLVFTPAEPSSYVDEFVQSVNSTLIAFYPDVLAGGTSDAVAAYTSDGTTDYFEFSHSLCSGDVHDFCLHVGDTVGFDTLYSSNCPVSCPVGSWPQNSGPYPDASGFGKIVIAGPTSGVPPFSPQSICQLARQP